MGRNEGMKDVDGMGYQSEVRDGDGEINSVGVTDEVPKGYHFSDMSPADDPSNDLAYTSARSKYSSDRIACFLCQHSGGNILTGKSGSHSLQPATCQRCHRVCGR